MNQDYFELFELPARFAIDISELEQTWRSKSSQVHPDRFATASDTEKRVAMQWASLINEAYQVLKNPIKRATYLCEQQGMDVAAESNTSMPPAFLFKQMEWREDLDAAAGNQEALEQLMQQVQGEADVLNQEMGDLIDQQKDWSGAVEKLRQWMFIDKFRREIKEQLD
ncbi:Hsc20 [Oligella ureolytica]|uniref:Co-chaperone protein HscB homolog n=1 Tax=Oligella ureolytica TaxID=90244 RepID=A0A378XJA4_9BURK|nr:Fe-S protein assembly co-chaperone HscB [Oligella ureolytica]NLP32956.1 Fe-S protein assembly co-chaperone HscB [Oligella ureolytica]QPT39725.1 Fe-S protein assembly co-chaperone HscB [Oligella ureolytica]SUA52305.1 Hsc20 [Oligella ureolytica]SUA57326.1 Hsc20 [Oligella ureolytica]